MKNQLLMASAMSLMVALLAGVGTATGAGTAEDSALPTALRLLEAFNRHDPAAMAALMDENFELYYVTGGKSELSAYQASARGGQIQVRVAGDRVHLAGNAVTVLRAELI